ncbi:MAG: hypothetical protein EOM29_00405 [Bacteroidia bacterium]|nr:hypothetical protein [Bacteroidia bacterium]
MHILPYPAYKTISLSYYRQTINQSYKKNLLGEIFFKYSEKTFPLNYLIYINRRFKGQISSKNNPLSIRVQIEDKIIDINLSKQALKVI